MPAPLIWGVELQKPLKFADFDKSVLKPRMRKVGRDVVKLARKNVSRKAVSKPNEFPGRETGLLRRAITAKVSRSGFSVGIMPYPSAFERAKEDFYAPFVYYGHRAPNTDSEKEHHKVRTGSKVAAPRKNFVVDAVERYGKTRYEAEIRALLADAIKPGLIGEGLSK